VKSGGGGDDIKMDREEGTKLQGEPLCSFSFMDVWETVWRGENY
jgi:hypothetical protein